MAEILRSSMLSTPLFNTGLWPRALTILQEKVPKYLIAASEKFSRKNYCVNCWHVNEGESAAMWDLYANSKGIAIRSTVGRLKKSLRPEQRKIALCKVEYGEARNA